MMENQEYINEELNECENDTIDTEVSCEEADNTEKGPQEASEDCEDTFSEEEEESLSKLKDTINVLKARISELERTKETQERILTELGDFNSLFPNTPIDDIPESVWDMVKKGTSLAASYALYEKRNQAEIQRREQINQRNASKSAGIAGKDTANEYFSPEEVRKMSRAEVHANFSKIRKSMQKWI